MKNMAHMKLSKKDAKEREKTIGSPDRDEYPYGLRLRLENESLDKLGMKDLPKVGHKMHVHGKGVVTSVSSHEHKDGHSRHVEIQLHHMGVEGEEPSIKDTLKSRYDELKGKKVKDPDKDGE